MALAQNNFVVFTSIILHRVCAGKSIHRLCATIYNAILAVLFAAILLLRLRSRRRRRDWVFEYIYSHKSAMWRSSKVCVCVCVWGGEREPDEFLCAHCKLREREWGLCVCVCELCRARNGCYINGSRLICRRVFKTPQSQSRVLR